MKRQVWNFFTLIELLVVIAIITAYRNMGRKALRKKLQELEEKMWNS